MFLLIGGGEVFLAQKSNAIYYILFSERNQFCKFMFIVLKIADSISADNVHP